MSCLLFIRRSQILFFLRKERLLEEAIDLAKYPEDRNQKNRNYEQQKLSGHGFELSWANRLAPDAIIPHE